MTIFSSCPCLPGQNRPPHKKDGPWSWVVLFSSVLQNWLLVGVLRGYGLYLPVFMREFNEGREKIALIGSLGSGGAFLSTVLTSWLCSHYGGNLVCGVGYILIIVSLILSSLMYNVYAMFFTHSLLFAVGVSFIATTNILFTAKYFKKRRSFALGLNSGGAGLGVMTVPIIIQYILALTGWRNLFRILSGCFALFAFMSLVFDPNVEEESHGDSDETADSPNRGRVKKGLSLRSMLDLSVWKEPKFTIAVISISIATFVIFNPIMHLVKYSEEIGVPAAQASTLYTFIGLTSIISRIVAGRLCDFRCIDASIVNMSSEMLGSVNLFLLPFAKSYAHLVLFSCVLGLVDGTFRSTSNILYTTSVVQSKASSALGQGYSMSAPFLIAGPAIAGLMADTTGTYKTAFFMSGSVLLCAAAVHILPACIALRNRARDHSLDHITMETRPSSCVNIAYRERKSSAKYDASQVNFAFGP